MRTPRSQPSAQCHCPPVLTWFRDFAQRAGRPRGDTSRRRKTTAVASAPAAFRRGRWGSLGAHGSVPDPEREIHGPGHWYRAQGCERGVRISLVSFHAPVTGRPAVSRGRLGLRRPAAALRAELDRTGRARRGARISRGQLCQALGIDQQRHAPAGPGIWAPPVLAGFRSSSRAFQGHRRLRLQPTILARRIVPRLSLVRSRCSTPSL